MTCTTRRRAWSTRLRTASSSAWRPRWAFPSHDPHGAPIPTQTGQIEASDFITLAAAEPGARVLIRAVQDNDPELLRAAEALGLIPGTRLTVGPGGGAQLTVIIDHDGSAGERHSVPPDLASHVFVLAERADEE